MGNCLKTCCGHNNEYKFENTVETTSGNQNLRPQYYFKVLLIGDRNVGKSSLIRRITSDEIVDTITPTIGVDFARKSLVINDFIVKYHFWDPSGDQRFRQLLPNYFSGINAVLVMYDISNEQTFKSCRDSWLPFLKANARPKPTVSVILANKTDLSSNRVISVSEGLQLANETNSMFMEVSAKNGDNVDNLLNSIGSQLIAIHQQTPQQY